MPAPDQIRTLFYRKSSIQRFCTVYFTSGDIIGRYERDEVTPSVEVASKLADVLDVSLDYLSGKTDTELDSATLSRIMEISVMPEDDKKQVFLVLDALIRDYKARKAYAQ
ncbi:helix-turn-helix domain-containing protein [Sphingobacterium faecium]|nr:helix-turn-helix domain-containing protein [Sphingobacterium faecium]